MKIPGMETASPRDWLGIDLAKAQIDMIHALKAIRLERGLTVVQVAHEMKVDPSVVSRLEGGGTNPTFATLRKYAKALDAMITYQVEPRHIHRSHIVAKNAEAWFENGLLRNNKDDTDEWRELWDESSTTTESSWV